MKKGTIMESNGNGNGQLVEYQDVQSAAINPMDAAPQLFRAGLDRRKENRNTLMEWIRSSLVEGRDFGSIIIKGRRSKASLFKPGAEKITAMLGLVCRFPNLEKYETAVLEGVQLDQIIIRCNLVNQIGEVIGEGVGARSIESQDHGDINKALKMSCKSAMIDATLRCAGISEVFTQDIEDMHVESANSDERPEQKAEHEGGNMSQTPFERPRAQSEEELATERQVAAVRGLIDNPKVYPDEKRQIHELLADGLSKVKAKELLDFYYGVSILVGGEWTKMGNGQLSQRS
jgi:hypothetical protein